jgi:hypothetical protein
MSLIRSIRIHFPEFEQDDSLLPQGVCPKKTEGNAVLRSYAWKGEIIRRARLCEFEVPGKFTAETLVIYPHWETKTPIFGTEYITIAGKKFFGAIDFHPLSQDPTYIETHIDEYLYDFPRRSTEQSKFYDLSKYFSSRFWIRKSDTDFHDDYINWTERYLARYKMALMYGNIGPSNRDFHVAYDKHMAENDPAHGILKSYFSEDFANFYVKEFLFDMSTR